MSFDQVAWPRRTDRLTIRPALASDLSAVFAIRSLPEVAEWMPDRPRSYDEWVLRLGRSGADDRMLVMAREDTIVGDLYLHVENAWAQLEVREAGEGAQAEIGWVLAPAHQGQGLVTEACAELLRICFSELGVRRVVANAFADNAPSLRVMERLKMTCEARNRADSLHRDRGWLDGVTYALLRDEWQA